MVFIFSCGLCIVFEKAWRSGCGLCIDFPKVKNAYGFAPGPRLFSRFEIPHISRKKQVVFRGLVVCKSNK